MHKDNEFTLYRRVELFVPYVSRNVAVSIPKIHNNLRIKLLDESYMLLRQLVEAIYTKGKVRLKAINEMLISLTMLNILLEEVNKLDIISQKHIGFSIKLLADIKNMTIAWKKTEESTEQKKS